MYYTQCSPRAARQGIQPSFNSPRIKIRIVLSNNLHEKLWVWLIYTRAVHKQAVMLESTASAVSNTVALEASFSTTLKCMYFDNIIMLHIVINDHPL